MQSFIVRPLESWRNIRKIVLAGVESANVRKMKGSVNQSEKPNWYGTFKVKNTMAEFTFHSLMQLCFAVWFLQEILKRNKKSSTWVLFLHASFAWEVVHLQDLLLARQHIDLFLFLLLGFRSTFANFQWSICEHFGGFVCLYRLPIS